MKTVGIIAEFNPFHNGHKLLFDAARRMGADKIVVVMSGEFVQSGEPAFASKEIRTRFALECGADAVFLLPAYFATSSAEGFAYGGVSLLNSLGIIDELLFGCETDNIDQIKRIAKILLSEPESYKAYLKNELKKGMSFPRARANALGLYTKNKGDTALISSPNSILGIEYCKAIYRLGSRINPVAILRQGDGYHSKVIDGELISATAIRDLFIKDNKSALEKICSCIPIEIQSLFASECHETFPILRDDYMEYLIPILLTANLDKIKCADLNNELKNRLKKVLYSDYPLKYEDFILELKTKNETFGHIGRVLTHIILKIQSRDMMKCPYARLLGFRDSSTDIFSEIKEKASIPLISRFADAEKIIGDFYYNDDTALSLLSIDRQAYKAYQYLLKKKYNIPFIPEEKTRMTIL